MDDKTHLCTSVTKFLMSLVADTSSLWLASTALTCRASLSLLLMSRQERAELNHHPQSKNKPHLFWLCRPAALRQQQVLQELLARHQSSDKNYHQQLLVFPFLLFEQWPIQPFSALHVLISGRPVWQWAHSDFSLADQWSRPFYGAAPARHHSWQIGPGR